MDQDNDHDPSTASPGVGAPTNEPGVAQDPRGSGLLAATDERSGAGFPGQFQVAADAEIRCLTCREVFPVGEIEEFDETRLEGASDPGDMSIVISLACPRCTSKGTWIARYGPEASAEEADALVALERKGAGNDHPQAAEDQPHRT